MIAATKPPIILLATMTFSAAVAVTPPHTIHKFRYMLGEVTVNGSSVESTAVAATSVTVKPQISTVDTTPTQGFVTDPILLTMKHSDDPVSTKEVVASRKCSHKTSHVKAASVTASVVIQVEQPASEVLPSLQTTQAQQSAQLAPAAPPQDATVHTSDTADTAAVSNQRRSF